MVTYDAFATWAADTFETHQGELVVYEDTMMGNVPFEADQMRTTMSVEELYDRVTDRIDAYDDPEEIRLNDFESRVNELHLSYWQDQGYVDAVEE